MDTDDTVTMGSGITRPRYASSQLTNAQLAHADLLAAAHHAQLAYEAIRRVIDHGLDDDNTEYWAERAHDFAQLTVHNIGHTLKMVER